MSRFSFISSHHNTTLSQAFIESFKHSLANLLGAGQLGYLTQLMLSWPASVRVVCPPLLLVLLLFGHEGPMWVVPSSPPGMCTQLDVWPWVFSTMGAAPGCTWVSVCLCIQGGVDAASHPHYQVYLLTDTHIQNTTRLFVCASMFFFFLLFPFRRCLFLYVFFLTGAAVYQLVLRHLMVSVSQRFPSQCCSKGVIIVGVSLCIIVGSLSYNIQY